MATTTKAKYWVGEPSVHDDFGDLIVGQFVDGRTKRGIWALMTPQSWETHGCGRFGEGAGQRYLRTAKGWLKVEG